MNEPVIVPFDRKAEEGVIGGILINPSSYYEAIQHVKVRDFFIHTNQFVFEAFTKLLDEDMDIDIVTVSAMLVELGHDVPDHVLTKILTSVPSSLHVSSYAKVVADKASRRRLLVAAQDMAKLAYDETTPVNIGDVSEKLYTTIRVRGKGAEPWTGSIEEFAEDFEAQLGKPYSDVWGMSYGRGFAKLNYITGGAQTSEFCIIAGKPGAGKSVIVADWIAEWSKEEWGVIYSMEMPDDVWIRRHVSREAGVSTRDLLRGSVKDEAGKVRKAIESLKQRKVILSDHEDWKSDELRADLTRLKHKYNIKWAVIDHMGLLSDVSDSDITQSKAVAQRLRKAARALEIHIVAISAVTKDGFDDGYPTMKNVRGSGEVLHEADLVYWLSSFTPMSKADKSALQLMSGEDTWQAKERMRTFFILKGRHLTGSNIKYKHLAFAENRPSLAETQFPPEEEQRSMPIPYKDD